ncbi:MAG: radical SAM protein, partial [Actinocrinis sp.]
SIRWDAQRVDRVDGAALPGLAKLNTLVRSVRTPEFQNVTFHEVLAKTALNHVPNDARMLPGEYTINPYRGCTHACQYCFARATHTRLELNMAEDFDREIIVKVNIVDVLREELARKRRLPPRVAFGTNTDVYQRAEGRYALMPGIIDALTDFKIPFSILTKGTIIRRDLDRLARAGAKMTVNLGLSISLMDDRLQQSVEPGTATTTARLATVRAIREAGMDCAVFVGPILPQLTDSPAQLEEMAAAIADAGATSVLFTPLYMPHGVKDVYFDWLRREYPDLVPSYAQLYSSGSQAPLHYREEIGRRARAAFAKYGLPDPDEGTDDLFALNGRRGAKQPAEADDGQMSLF